MVMTGATVIVDRVIPWNPKRLSVRIGSVDEDYFAPGAVAPEHSMSMSASGRSSPIDVGRAGVGIARLRGCRRSYHVVQAADDYICFAGCATDGRETESRSGNSSDRRLIDAGLPMTASACPVPLIHWYRECPNIVHGGDIAGSEVIVIAVIDVYGVGYAWRVGPGSLARKLLKPRKSADHARECGRDHCRSGRWRK